jgi:hypothetical protein
MRWPTRVVSLLAAAALAVIGATGSAGAASSRAGLQLEVPGGGFSAHPSRPLFDVVNLAPGMTVHGVLGIRNGATSGGSVTIVMRDLAPGSSALAGVLEFGLSVSAARAGDYTSIWSGRAAGLEQGVRVTNRLAARGTVWLRADATLPATAGNDLESSRLGFDLRVTLAGPDGSSTVGVEGAGGEPAPAGASTTSLPLTGVPAALLAAVAILLVLAGAVTVLAARRRAA